MVVEKKGMGIIFLYEMVLINFFLVHTHSSISPTLNYKNLTPNTVPISIFSPKFSVAFRHSLTYRGAMLNIGRYRLRASSCPDIYRNSMTTIAEEKDEVCNNAHIC